MILKGFFDFPLEKNPNRNCDPAPLPLNGKKRELFFDHLPRDNLYDEGEVWSLNRLGGTYREKKPTQQRIYSAAQLSKACDSKSGETRFKIDESMVLWIVKCFDVFFLLSCWTIDTLKVRSYLLYYSTIVYFSLAGCVVVVDFGPWVLPLQRED